jgi:N-acetylglucosamine-6-phosphate deacetylase
MRLGVGAALVEGELLPGDVEVVGGRVYAVGLGAGRGSSEIAVPGFVDLQVNGYAGVDFSTADRHGYLRAGDAMLRDGVTAYQPTIVTGPIATMTEALRQVPRDLSGPEAIGAHVEGPFLSARQAGAHAAAELRPPSPALLERLLAAGPVSQMTLAPELPGALATIEALVARGVTVSCGHSDATAEQAGLAFDRGASAATHLFNAMRAFHPRDPGIAFAALSRPDVFIPVILDGHHIAAETARVTWLAAGDRLALVTDAVAAAGCADGSFTLGGVVEVESRDGVVRDGNGALAGSTLSMIEAVRNLHALGVPLEAALGAASRTPARLARRPDLGRLEPGSRADIVVLDDRLEIARVIVGGAELVAH